jgi:hypothetical protein
VVPERWEEKGEIVLPFSGLHLGLWSQDFHTTPGQSQPPFLMGISSGHAPTTHNDAPPPANSCYQSSGLESIGSGRPSQSALNSFNGSHEYNQFGR